MGFVKSRLCYDCSDYYCNEDPSYEDACIDILGYIRDTEMERDYYRCIVESVHSIYEDICTDLVCLIDYISYKRDTDYTEEVSLYYMLKSRFDNVPSSLRYDMDFWEREYNVICCDFDYLKENFNHYKALFESIYSSYQIMSRMSDEQCASNYDNISEHYFCYPLDFNL